MKVTKLAGILLMVCVGTMCGCSTMEQKAPDVTNQIRSSLDQAGLKDVSVTQDRDKGVVTLKGTTTTDTDKAQAESIAKSIASTEVVANEIAVRPVGDEGAAKSVDSDQDKAIEKNFNAALTKNKMQKEVKYDVKNGVITLKGKVNTRAQREEAEKLATDVPNVKQVVNELVVKNERATSKKTSSD